MPLALVVLGACGRGPATAFDDNLEPVVHESVRLADVTGPVVLRGEPSGFFPATLAAAVVVRVPEGGTAQAKLPISASASTVWVTVQSDRPARVTSGGSQLTLNGVEAALAPLFIKAGAVDFTADADVQLTVQTLGYFDQSGAGFEMASGGVSQMLRVPMNGRAEVELESPAEAEPDDTWATWVMLDSTNRYVDDVLPLGACDGAPSEALRMNTLGKEVLTLLPKGKICVSGSSEGHFDLYLHPVARFRRFAKTHWRGVEPMTLIDTAQAVGWSGKAGADQSLEIPLRGIRGLSDAKQVMLLVSTVPGPTDFPRFAVGPCGGVPQTYFEHGSTRTLIVDAQRDTCIQPGAASHLRVEVVGMIQEGEAAVTQCPRRATPPECDATDLLGRLNCIPGVSAHLQPSKEDPTVSDYALSIVQPIDHARPDGPAFSQRVLVSYAGPNADIALHTTGYELFNYTGDLAATFPLTEVEVEHRFFGSSRPLAKDYSTLDIVQSAQDSHRIVELLRPVLGNNWVSTGHSKGGMTALFHRRFFPCDVDGTVPFVTPISYGLADTRYGEFLQTVGGEKYEACRQVFRDIDRGIIADRARYAAQFEGSFTKMGGAENALWASVGLNSWSLFQYTPPDDPMQGCPAYVDARANPAFSQVIDAYAQYAATLSDEAFAQASPETDPVFAYLYQTVNELGDQGATLTYLADLGPVPDFPHFEPLMLGSVAPPSFDARSMHDVQDWVQNHGDHLLFIYGEFDPWTAGAVELGNAKDSAKLIAAGANHGARFANLSPEDRERAKTLVQSWFGPAQRLGGVAPPRRVNRPQFHEVMKKLKL